MSKFQLEGTPDGIAEALVESPGQWFVVGTARRGDNQSLRTFAYRVKANRNAAFRRRAAATGDGRWETTVRTDGAESLMYARWVPGVGDGEMAS